MTTFDERITQKDLMTRREWVLLLALVAVALLLRIGLSQLPRVVKWDESDYLMLGRNLWRGQGFTTAGYPEVHYPPLLPMLLGATYALVAEPETASNIWYVVAGALLLLPYYGLARAWYGQRSAAMATALLVLFPALAVGVLYWGTMSEPLYLLLIYTGLYSLWLGLHRNQTRYYALAALMFVLAYLTRPEGIVYWGLFALVILLWQWGHGRLRQAATWRHLATYGAVFVLAALPYIIYLHQHTGQWTFSGKVGVTLALGEAVIEHDPAAYDIATASLDQSGHHAIWFSPERFQSPGMLQQVLADPLGFARRVLANVRTWRSLFFQNTIFPAWLLVVVALALFVRPWSRSRAWQELFLIAAMLPPFAFLALHIEIRFFAPVFPLLLIWVAKGLDILGMWLRDTVRGWEIADFGETSLAARALSVLPLIGLLLFFAVAQPILARSYQQGTDYSYKEVGLWLKAHSPTEAVILSRDVAVAVYADRAWVPSPHADYAALLKYARYHKVNYIVTSDREITVLRPMLSMLLDVQDPPREVELVQVIRGVPGQGDGRTLVYRLRE